MKWVLFLTLLTVISGCASTTATHDNLTATLWFQTAAEYRGNAMTVYGAAEKQLQHLGTEAVTADLEQAAMHGCTAGVGCAAMADKNLVPAVILDVDETALDNHQYAAWQVQNNQQ